MLALRRNRSMADSKKNKVKVLFSNLFPVVGIGASAGGLDAFKRVLKAIPEDSGSRMDEGALFKIILLLARQ
jgi:chemotaxis response regulator CheB